MVENLKQEMAEKEAQLSALEGDLKLLKKGDAIALSARKEKLEKELSSIQSKLADKQEKLQVADKRLSDLKENMNAVQERTEELKEEAYKYSRDVHSKWIVCLKMPCWKKWSMNTGIYRHDWNFRNSDCSAALSYNP